MARLETPRELELLVDGMSLATSLGYHADTKAPYKDLSVVLDLETTGFDPQRCQVVQIAARVLQPLPFKHPTTPSVFQSYVKLESKRFTVFPEAMKVNKIPEATLLDEALPTWERMSVLFVQWLEELYETWKPCTITLVGYSGNHFDSRFVIKGARLAQKVIPKYVQFADARTVLNQFVPEEMKRCEKQKLSFVFERLVRIKVNEDMLHSAYTDTLVLTAVLLAANAIVRVDSRSPLIPLFAASHESPLVQDALKFTSVKK